ncbi:MAG: tRNA adenosine(34) deaminase TadA [Clostridia bacterium]|nr:tRNA adenosine(34) deaminase TadA [Clostridia bacterium]
MTEQDYMNRALALAEEAYKLDEVPVGAVVVYDGQIIGEGYNRRELSRNALAHAELEAIDEACRRFGSWRLFDCELYVTLEPCPMCTGAIINSRIKRVVFGAYDPKAGSMGSILNLCDYPFNSKPLIEGGFMQEECAEILSRFFADLRVRKLEQKRSREDVSAPGAGHGDHD